MNMREAEDAFDRLENYVRIETERGGLSPRMRREIELFSTRMFEMLDDAFCASEDVLFVTEEEFRHALRLCVKDAALRISEHEFRHALRMLNIHRVFGKKDG